MPGVADTRKESMAEIAASLLKLEGEKIEVVQNTAAGKASVISDRDLNALLDRSPEVFHGRVKGWTSAKNKAVDAPVKTAFEVYEGRTDETNDALANMMGEVE